MEPEDVRFFDGHKFMWDGVIYDTKQDANSKQGEYEESGFEVRLFEQEDKFLLYTRRVVTEIVLEGEPPP
jgi:hypothetical protein